MSNKHQPTGTKTEVLPPEILVHQQQESIKEVSMPDADDRMDFIEFFNEVDASLGQSPPNTLKIETSNHLPSSTLSKHSRLPKPPKAPPPPPPRTNGIFLASELDTDLSSAAIDPSAASADTTNHHHQNNIIHQRPSQLHPTQPSTLVKREETTTARIPAAIRPTYIPPRRPSDPLLDPNFKPISRSSNNKKNSIDNQEDPKIQKSSVYPGGKGSKSTPFNFLNLLLLTFVAFSLS